MNIFVLDNDIKKCAKYHLDRHVVKMITEHAQMLSTAVRLNGIDEGFKITHQNHPCSKWVRESLDNWMWLYNLTKELHNEWRYRYEHPEDKEHKSWTKVKDITIPNLPKLGLTPFAQAMPDKYKHKNAVKAYRNYYINEKHNIANWKKRSTPTWFK